MRLHERVAAAMAYLAELWIEVLLTLALLLMAIGIAVAFTYAAGLAHA